MDLQLIISIIIFWVTIAILIWIMIKNHIKSMYNKESLTRGHERIDNIENTLDIKINESSEQSRTFIDKMEKLINLLVEKRTK